MRISDWSSDVCSSDLGAVANLRGRELRAGADADLRHPLPPVPAAGRDRRPLPRAGRRIGDRRMTGTLPIKQAATGVALILAIAAPWLLSAYDLNLLARFLALSLTAMGLVLIWGEEIG